MIKNNNNRCADPNVLHSFYRASTVMTVIATLSPLSVLSHGLQKKKIISCVLKIDVTAADYVFWKSLQSLHFESFAQIWTLVLLLLSVI